jgi:transcriptional regulator GlxA family with amidase domain
MATKQIQRYHNIVARFECRARTNPGAFKNISEFCRIASVSQSTLLRAFHTIYDTTPLLHLRALRLDQARQALLSSRARHETVTKIATRYGFGELGRFAADYRERFGESPSETLQRTAENSNSRSAI